MKKKIKLGVIFFLTTIAIMGGGKSVQAKSYSIEDMDIQATVEENGSVHIEQEITYHFKGSYNGIYINIPYQLEAMEYEEVVKENKINDKLYNGSNVVVNKVCVLNNRVEIPYTEVSYASNGRNGVYTNTKGNGMQTIKVYSPSTDMVKTFKINYTIENLCVKHNDIGELYYNFIGGAWEVEIKKLNIDIYLPKNQTEIQVWGHGPYQGKSQIISHRHANFQVKNIKPGQYVAARVIFDQSNIPNANKISRINAKDIIYQDENTIRENKEEKNAFTQKIILFTICLCVYWVILMFVFEKDKKYEVSNIAEEELFQKYNPMLAGCIQGSRTILARDIIAVILELINKKIIKLEINPVLEKGDDYCYQVVKNKQAENQMDSMEKYVYDWVFDQKEQVNLAVRLEQMPKEEGANQKFKRLNDLVEENLKTKGANQAKVPLSIRIFNVFLFVLSIVVIAKHILFNGFNIYNSQTSTSILWTFSIYLVAWLPLILGLLYIPINLIIRIRHKINKTVQKITGQRVVTTTISLLVFYGVIMILTAIFSPVKYILADEALIAMATILILTDNLMLKNNAIMIEDYSRLNALKQKIEDYTMMEDRDVEQLVLWEQYLSYAVSFGIANKIIKRIQGLHIDEDLVDLLKDSKIKDLIHSDYYLFYHYASLDIRFMKAYGETVGKVLTSGGDSSSGGGGGFSGRGGFSGGGGSGRRPEARSNIKNARRKNGNQNHIWKTRKWEKHILLFANCKPIRKRK